MSVKDKKAKKVSAMVGTKQCFVPTTLQRFASDHMKKQVIKGAHTEIVVEPRCYVGGKVNPQVAELLVSAYLRKCSKQDLENGRITVEDGLLIIRDTHGNPVARVRKQKIIQEFMAKT